MGNDSEIAAEVQRNLHDIEDLRQVIVDLREHVERSSADDPFAEVLDLVEKARALCQRLEVREPIAFSSDNQIATVAGPPPGGMLLEWPLSRAQADCSDEEWIGNVRRRRDRTMTLLGQWLPVLSMQRVWEVEDDLGPRMLFAPLRELPFSGDPSQIVLDIEARTRVRLRNGGNPNWFMRLHHHFRERSDPNAGVSFAEFCRRRHPGKIDIIPQPAMSGENLIARLLSGPDDLELTSREMALLGAHMKQRISGSTVQREKRATGESETLKRRAKLKLIWDFNRALQEANAASANSDPAEVADAKVGAGKDGAPSPTPAVPEKDSGIGGVGATTGKAEPTSSSSGAEEEAPAVSGAEEEAPAVDEDVQRQPDGDTPKDPLDPTARCASGSVLLFSRQDAPIVNGEEKETLTKAQYDVVLALLKAGDKGLTKDQLDGQSGHGDARKVIQRLAKRDSGWDSVISFPGTPGKGYRIL